jgi:hypothetical protein
VCAVASQRDRSVPTGLDQLKVTTAPPKLRAPERNGGQPDARHALLARSAVAQ